MRTDERGGRAAVLAMQCTGATPSSKRYGTSSTTWRRLARQGRIVIRPHPSEPARKYDGIVAGYSVPVSFSRGDPLSTEVVSSDCIVGCGSMAMVVGLIAGKRVVSCIPPGGAPCPLPQRDIESLQDLVRTQG